MARKLSLVLWFIAAAFFLSQGARSAEGDDVDKKPNGSDVIVPDEYKNLPIDKEALLEAKKQSILYGPYLPVLSVVYEHFCQHAEEDEFFVYIITIEENEKNFVVNFSIPYEHPVLGDGSGKYVVDKRTYEIVSVEFSR